MLLALVLTVLLVAIALHVRFLILARREHRQTTNALDATEREFKSVFDKTLDGIRILDDRGTCLEANPAAQIMFGTRRDDLVGRPIGNFCTWKQFLDPRYEHGETQVLRGDGMNIFVEYTAKAHYLPGRHVAVLRDISRRKQAEAALRESEERFQQMATNIQEIFWMLDAENLKVIYVNSAYETITGRSCESLQEDPKSYEDVIHPEDRVRVLSRLGEAVQEYGDGITVDPSGAAYVVGTTLSSNFPVTPGAYQTSIKGGCSGFISELMPLGNGSADLVYSTFLGGTEPDATCIEFQLGATHIALDSSHNVHVTGATQATDFPVSPSNAFQTSLTSGSLDDYIAKLSLTPAITPTPVITSLSVASGATGSNVTISGNNFGKNQGTSTVAFGSAMALVLSWVRLQSWHKFQARDLLACYQ